MEKELFTNMDIIHDKHWWFLARELILDRALSRMDLGKDINILEIGCGIGNNLKLLGKYGKVTAVEKDDGAIEYAKQRSEVEIHKGWLPDDIPLEVNTGYDLIAMFDVLEHIENDKESLNMLSKLLHDQGKVILTVPAYQFLWGEHDIHHHHFRRYHASQLKDMLVETGWRIEYLSYFNTILFPIAALHRLLNKMIAGKNNGVTTMPGKTLNNILYLIFSIESWFIYRMSFMFGLSIMVIVTRGKQ